MEIFGVGENEYLDQRGAAEQKHAFSHIWFAHLVCSLE